MSHPSLHCLDELLRAVGRWLSRPVESAAHAGQRQTVRVAAGFQPLSPDLPLNDGVGSRIGTRRSVRTTTTRFHLPACDH